MDPATELGAEAVFPVEDEVLTAAVLGAGLPEAAEQHLRLAASSYRDDDLAEAHLWQAKAAAPDHPAVLIGLYRFYFYKNRLPEALSIARACLEKSAKDNRLPLDWREVRPSDAAFGDFGAALPRFYLFTLKGYAYLNMRLGHIEEAQAVIAKLLELDSSDKVGANILLGVLERMGQEDD
jgi:tetratricopeptide (TPR) repeat protein